MKKKLRNFNRMWLSALLICRASLISPILSHGQSPSVKTGVTSRSKAGTNMTPKEVTLSGNSLTLNLDRQGTSFTVSLWPAGTAPEDVNARQQVLIFPVAFGVKDGCNGWFSKEAIFILDQSWTIKVPWAADCPLPPKAKYLPIWALESIASANSVAMKLDGKTLLVTARQLAAFKSFVESRCLPDAAWRETHEPYAASKSVSALDFLGNLLTNSPGKMWDTALEPDQEQRKTLEADDHSLVIHAFQNLDPQKEASGVFQIKKTWSLSWNSVILTYILQCENGAQCVSVHTVRENSYQGERLRPIEQDDKFSSLFNAPYVPGDGVAFSDFNRAVGYLWYQNIFLNQAH